MSPCGMGSLSSKSTIGVAYLHNGSDKGIEVDKQYETKATVVMELTGNTFRQAEDGWVWRKDEAEFPLRSEVVNSSNAEIMHLPRFLQDSAIF